MPFLERGTNVVTFSGFAIAHPATAPPELRETDRGCLPQGQQHLLLHRHRPRLGDHRPGHRRAGGCQPHRLRARDGARVVRATTRPSSPARVLRLRQAARLPAICSSPAGSSSRCGRRRLHQLAEVLGVEIDELTRVLYETDCLDHDVETGFGTVEAGTASVVHFEFQALRRADRRDRRARRPCGPRCRQAVEAAVRPVRPGSSASRSRAIPATPSS